MKNLQEALRRSLEREVRERVIEITRGMEGEALRRFKEHCGERNPEVGRFGCFYRAILNEMWDEYGRRN